MSFNDSTMPAGKNTNKPDRLKIMTGEGGLKQNPYIYPAKQNLVIPNATKTALEKHY